MRLTQRDYEILHTIYRYDGLLSVDQFHRWFFGVKRRAYYRIEALCAHGCLQRLARQDRFRVPEPIVWLDKMGAQVLANYLGVEYSELRWRSQPRWNRVSHDIALNEFRHTVEQVLPQHQGYELDIWHGQDELERIFPLPVPYLDLTGERKQKVVKPDGYFCLRITEDQPYRLRFFVELDNNTESSRRFGREKVSPTVHLMLSSRYQQELGGKSGRILLVAVGSEPRFHQLRHEITAAGGAGYFLCTRSEWVSLETLLTAPIFYLPHLDKPIAFPTYHRPDFQQYLQKSLVQVPRLVTL